jgi:putative aldouronate transport system substrate-binding protein
VKKQLGLITLSCMLAFMGILAACSNGNNGASGSGSETAAAGAGQSNAKIKLKMMGFKNPIQSPWEQMSFFKDMEKKTNIAFQFITPPSDGYDEKKNLAFASGELPDVFFGGMLTAGDEVKYGSVGTLIPLEGLIDKYAPNITKMFEEMPDIKKSITAPDGHIYALPNINKAPIAVTSPMWINDDWVEAVGGKLPQTTDELYQLLKDFKDKDPNRNGQPDEIPLSSSGKLNEMRSVIMPAFGVLSREVEVNNDKVSFGAMSNGYKEYIKFMNKLWQEKLIDQEAYTQKYPDMNAKGKNNQIGMAVHAIPSLIWNVKSEDDFGKYPVMPVLTSQVNATKMYTMGSGINRGAFAITNLNKHPVDTIRWVDYLYSEEGSIFIHYGKEGDFWEYVDKANGTRRQIPPKNGQNGEEYRGSFTPDVGTPTPKWVRDSTEGSWVNKDQQYRIKEVDAKLKPYAKLPFPLVYFTADEQNELDSITTDMNTYLEQKEAQFITGQESVDAKWDEFTGQLRKMGVEKLIAINQAAYDRWKNAK